jgi:vacuolar-type H+-ATPase subunit H
MSEFSKVLDIEKKYEKIISDTNSLYETKLEETKKELKTKFESFKKEIKTKLDKDLVEYKKSLNSQAETIVSKGKEDSLVVSTDSKQKKATEHLVKEFKNFK